MLFSDHQRFTGNAERKGIELFKASGTAEKTMRGYAEDLGNAIQVAQLPLAGKLCADQSYPYWVWGIDRPWFGASAERAHLNDFVKKKVCLV